MKKTILFGVGLMIAYCGNAQTLNNQNNKAKIPAYLSNIPAVKTSIYAHKENNISYVQSQPINNGNSASKRTKLPGALSTSATEIGNTLYQLQTNASVRNALFKSKDGSISAVWNYSPEYDATQAYPKRGTGYAYYNGSSWTTENPSSRIESQRTGWPSIAVTTNNTEAIVSHNTTVDDLEFISRSSKGTGSWTEDKSVTDIQ